MRAPKTTYEGGTIQRLVCVVCQKTVATPSSAQSVSLAGSTKDSILETSTCILTASPGGVGVHPPFPQALFIYTLSRIICHITDGDKGIIYNSWTLSESHCLQPRPSQHFLDGSPAVKTPRVHGGPEPCPQEDGCLESSACLFSSSIAQAWLSSPPSLTPTGLWN